MSIYNIPEPPIEPPKSKEKPVYICEDTNGCDYEIFEGEDHYFVDGYRLCPECGRAYLDELYLRKA